MRHPCKFLHGSEYGRAQQFKALQLRRPLFILPRWQFIPQERTFDLVKARLGPLREPDLRRPNTVFRITAID